MTRGARNPEIICRNPKCGKRFHHSWTGRQFCSRACSAVAQRRSGHIPDIICGNPKCRRKFHPTRRVQQYCSQACSVAMQFRHPPDETHARLAELRKSGMSYASIGKELGLSKSVVGKLCRRRELPSPSIRPGKWRPEDSARMHELLSSGMKYSDVAAAMGKSYSTIWNRALRTNQTPTNPPLCCPVCARAMDIRSRRHGDAWTPSQERLLLKLTSLKLPRKVIGAIFNTGVSGVEHKLVQIRERRK